MTYYAHSIGMNKSDWQTIQNHLISTSRLTLELGKDSGLVDFSFIAAMLHDIGKYTHAFQKRLEGASIKVDHSTAGAQEAKHLFGKNEVQDFIGTLLAYCITGHHGGLLDYGSEIDLDSDGTLLARLKKKVGDYSAYRQEIDIDQLLLPERLPLRPNKELPGFSIAFFTRMLYSILVDADFLETETFMQHGPKSRGGYPSIDTLCNQLNQYLVRFKQPIGDINRKRTEILTVCTGKAVEKPGLFTLTVPTGGGKTLISLSFALNHAITHGLKRIIYAIPYTSIIEQNAAVFKECLGEDNILEHHSNFEWNAKHYSDGAENDDDQTNDVLQKLKLAAENWDIPVVVTTNVQFFESLFANRSKSCRKLHNIAKSVIIFDEAQMLPRDYIQPCMYAVYELVRNYGCSAIFCTATQPAIERFLPGGAQCQELCPDPIALYQFFKRVKVTNLGSLADENLAQRINQHSQVLCIVNTRKHARGLFTSLDPEGRFHLSTLMCPVHRKKTTAEIKKRLKAQIPCRVISTQIMEAGIDVDFPVGYRAISGLDSIIQAAGRVNREGKEKSGELNVFEPDSEFVKRTPAYIQQGAEVAKAVLRKYADADPICSEAIGEYYRQLYNLQGEHAFDVQSILDCFDKGIPNKPAFDFKTAADRFNLIDNATIPVIIPYDDEARKLLAQLHSSSFPMSFSRKLQVYTVNIYEREYQVLLSLGKIDIYGETYAVLKNKDDYDEETGLVIPESTGGDAIFFDGR